MFMMENIEPANAAITTAAGGSPGPLASPAAGGSPGPLASPAPMAPLTSPAQIIAAGDSPIHPGGERRKNPAQKESYTKADFVFAPLLFVLGFLFIKLVVAALDSVQGPGAGVTVFTLCFAAVVMVRVGQGGVVAGRAAGFTLGVLLLTGLYFSVCPTAALGAPALAFLVVQGAYYTLLSGKGRIEDRVGPLLLFDLTSALLMIPFGNMGKIFAALEDRMRKKERRGNAAMLALGILLALPVCIYVGMLLQSADAAFEQFWLRLSDRFWSEDFIITMFQILISLPVSAYLYGLLFGVTKNSGKPRISAEKAADVIAKAKALPYYMVIGGVTPLLLLYLFFFFSQSAYYLSAFRGILPQGMVYAEYARRGFFELCTVSVINLLVLAVLLFFTGARGKKSFSPLKSPAPGEAVAPAEKTAAEGAAFGEAAAEDTDFVNASLSSTSAAFKIYGLLLALFSIALITMSLSKMLMYIGIYGLTPRRVYTSWFMVVQAVVFAAIILRIFRPRVNWVKICVCAFAVLFLALCFADTDKQIIRYNYEGYRSGKLEQLDVSFFWQLGPGATPWLIDIMEDESLPTEQRVRAQRILADRLYDYENRTGGSDWRFASLSGYKANRILLENREAILRELPDVSGR